MCVAIWFKVPHQEFHDSPPHFAFPKNLHHLTSDAYTLTEQHRLSVAQGKSGHDLDKTF